MCVLLGRLDKNGQVAIMRIPSLRERVRIEGRDHEFLVVWVDHEREVVDLIPMVEGGGLEESVPFHAIHPVGEDHH